MLERNASLSQKSLINLLVSEQEKIHTCCRRQLPNNVLCCILYEYLKTTSGRCGRPELLKLSHKRQMWYCTGLKQWIKIGCNYS